MFSVQLQLLRLTEDPQMAAIEHITLDEVIACFDALEVPRSPINRQHPLVSVVVIALMGVLAGANGPTAIARWAMAKKELLLQVLDLPTAFRAKTSFGGSCV